MAYKEKILIIRFSSLGDVALVSPVIKKLYSANYEVHLLTSNTYAELFKYNPYVKEIIKFNKKKDSILKLIKKIKSNQYTKIIDLQKNLRSFLIRLFFFKKTIVYKKFKFRRFLLVNFKINLLKNNSVIKNYLETLKKLNIKISPEDYNYEIFSSGKYKIQTKRKIITIAPYARWNTKIWPYYPQLVEKLIDKYYIILIGDPENNKRFNFKKNKNLKDLTGKLSFEQITDIIKCSALLITNDSGIMHIGAGTNKPVVAIFGSTVKEFGFLPLRDNIFLIENKNLKCRPCDYHGKDNCPEKHFKCMREITVEKILKKVEAILK